MLNRNMPENMYHSLQEAVKDVFGENAEIVKTERMHGGDINEAYRVSLAAGEKLFVKTNSINNAAFFQAESAGLSALGAAEKIGVPKILGMGIDESRGFSFLALEYIERSPRSDIYLENFGHQLAELHRAECRQFVTCECGSGKYGFKEDNFIGSGPQKNQPKEKWADFYRECRLLPQITMAEIYLGTDVRRKADMLLDRLERYLREPEFPSLLHGDLWSGNMICGCGGSPWIIDPAVYVGDFEADLAMTQLFGSLPERFYSAYSEINPIDWAGYLERKKLYDLYHLLNHLNLFGTAYLGSVVEIINEYGRV